MMLKLFFMLQGSFCLASTTNAKKGCLLERKKNLCKNIHQRHVLASCISGKFRLGFRFHCMSSSNILLTHLCVCVFVSFCRLVQTNLNEGCSPISRLKFWEQMYDGNMEESFVYMPQSLHLPCDILLFWGLEVGVLSRQRHVLTCFCWRKNLIAIE